MAVTFNGTQNVARTANVPDDALFTACGWAIRANTGVEQPLFTLLNNSFQGVVYSTDLDGSGVMIYASNTYEETVVNNSVAAGVPFFWAIKSSGTGATQTQGYFRAASSNTLTVVNLGYTRGAITPTGFSIGAFVGETVNGFQGRIWNVKIWDRALTDDELLIESYYRRVVFPANINVHYWLRSASDTADRSGNGRNPTVSGTLADGDEPVALWVPRRRIFVPVASEGGEPIEIEAGLDALALTERTAAVTLSQTVAASFDALTLTEQSAQIKLSKSISAGFDSLSIDEQSAVIALSKHISAGIDTLLISEQSANVSAGTGITAGTDSLVISEQTANVNRATAISAGVDALTIAEQAATVRLAKAITANLDALVITERQAAVSSGLQLSAALAELVLSEHQALVNRETAIQASFDQLTLAERQAAIGLATLVEASVDQLLLQERDAVLVLARIIAASFAELTIEEQRAVVEGTFAVTQVTAQRIIQVSRRNNVVRVAPRTGVTVH